MSWVTSTDGAETLAHRCRCVSVCCLSVEQKLIAEGAIVPVAVTLGLLKEAMQENMKQGKFNFLVDGYEEQQ
jgi:hypothetical protein